MHTFKTKKSATNKGFTLIELLVVTLIVSVLAAVSLPSLLVQVGKARESEAKSILGALNRAQQAYFTEKSVFANAGQIDNLEIPLGDTSYYTFSVVAEAVQKATGNNNLGNGTRDYLGGVQYHTDTGTYRGIICRSINSATNYSLAATDVVNAGIENSSNIIGCNTTTSEEIK
jgi:type IV pilus assembly protein PilA